MTAEVTGLIQAAGAGTRLGLGPKALLRLGDRTLVERSTAALEPLCDRVIVAAPPARHREVADLVSSPAVEVISGGPTRTATLCRLVAAAHGEWLLITDIAHPFAGSALARAVLDAALRHGAAMAALANTDHTLDSASGRVFATGAILTLQKPVACRAADLARALADAEAAPLGSAPRAAEPGVYELLRGSGVPVTLVPGAPSNIKITHQADMCLAAAIARAEQRESRRVP